VKKLDLLKKITLNKILSIYILIAPIIDALTSLTIRYLDIPLTIGMSVRIGMLIGVVIYSLIIANNKQRKVSIVYYSLIIIYLILFLHNSYTTFGTLGVNTQIKGILKVFSFPILLVSFYIILSNVKIDIPNKYFIWSLLIYCLLIIVPYFVGISFNTYEVETKYGTIGTFFAGNDIGTIICMLSCYLVIEIFNARKTSYLNLTIVGLVIFVSLFMGTKLPFFGVLSLLVITLFTYLIILICKKNMIYISKVLICLGLIFCIFIAVGYTPVGKNLNVKPLKKVSTSNTSEIIITQSIEKNEKKEVDLSNGRNGYLKYNLSEFKKSNFRTKLLGISYLDKSSSDLTRKLVEMDYYDIFLCHGYIGTSIYIIPILYIFTIICIEIMRKIRYIKCSIDMLFLPYAIIFEFTTANMAGHTLTSSSVNVLLSITIVKLICYLKNINENTKESTGGI